MKQLTQPLVSVIMPVYNAGDFLVEAVTSILAQTYKNLELICIDDASTDNSWSIVSKYQKKFPKKIKAYRVKKQTNAAGNGAMNYGLQFAKGSFIARMDADDISLPKRIEKQVAFMQKNPDVMLLGTQALIINRNSQVTGKKTMPTTHEQIYEQYGVFHPIIHPSVMIRRSMLPNKNRIYEMIWDVNDDYFTFFKFLSIGKFANLSESLLKYRVHGKNFSLKNPKQKFINSVGIRFAAVKNAEYRFSTKAAMLFLAQILFVLPMPERLIVPAYLWVKGIHTTLPRIKVSMQKLYTFI